MRRTGSWCGCAWASSCTASASTSAARGLSAPRASAGLPSAAPWSLGGASHPADRRIPPPYTPANLHDSLIVLLSHIPLSRCEENHYRLSCAPNNLVQHLRVLVGRNRRAAESRAAERPQSHDWDPGFAANVALLGQAMFPDHEEEWVAPAEKRPRRNCRGDLDLSVSESEADTASAAAATAELPGTEPLGASDDGTLQNVGYPHRWQQSDRLDEVQELQALVDTAVGDLAPALAAADWTQAAQSFASLQGTMAAVMLQKMAGMLATLDKNMHQALAAQSELIEQLRQQSAQQQRQIERLLAGRTHKGGAAALEPAHDIRPNDQQPPQQMPPNTPLAAASARQQENDPVSSAHIDVVGEGYEGQSDEAHADSYQALHSRQGAAADLHRHPMHDVSVSVDFDMDFDRGQRWSSSSGHDGESRSNVHSRNCGRGSHLSTNGNVSDAVASS